MSNPKLLVMLCHLKLIDLDFDQQRKLTSKQKIISHTEPIN